MTKGVAEEKEAKEKVEINIKGMQPEVKKISVIDVEPTPED